MSQFLKLVGPEEASSTLASLGLDGKRLAFFAVNSQTDASRAGGTHWSLLVYSVPQATFYHLDSAGIANESEARDLAAAIAGGAKDPGLKFCNLPPAASRQQSNGYDCGIFVLANTEHVTRHFLMSGGQQLNCDTLTAVSLEKVSNFRKHLHQLVLRLREEKCLLSK